ncbi:MAG: hypothetical protein H6R14_389 [Proteobacteria bacterium]|nr:hypothetical protein [Pseudomonadota bacterium]
MIFASISQTQVPIAGISAAKAAPYAYVFG